MTNDDDDDCTVLAYSQSARPTSSCHPTTVISVYFSQTLVILFILTKPSQLSVFVRSLPIPIVFAIAGQRCLRCLKFDRLGCSALSVVIVSAVLGVSPPGPSMPLLPWIPNGPAYFLSRRREIPPCSSSVRSGTLHAIVRVRMTLLVFICSFFPKSYLSLMQYAILSATEHSLNVRSNTLTEPSQGRLTIRLTSNSSFQLSEESFVA